MNTSDGRAPARRRIWISYASVVAAFVGEVILVLTVYHLLVLDSKLRDDPVNRMYLAVGHICVIFAGLTLYQQCIGPAVERIRLVVSKNA